MIVGVVGLVLIARDAVILRLWNVKYGDLPIVLAGALIGLVEVAVVCCAAYGLVRALGWLVGRFFSGRLS